MKIRPAIQRLALSLAVALVSLVAASYPACDCPSDSSCSFGAVSGDCSFDCKAGSSCSGVYMVGGEWHVCGTLAVTLPAG